MTTNAAPATIAVTGTTATATTEITATLVAMVVIVIETDPEIATQLVSQMGSGATAVSAGEEMEADLGRAIARARMLTQTKTMTDTPHAGAVRATDTVETVEAVAVTVPETAAAITTAAAAEVDVRALPAVTEAIAARIAIVIAPLDQHAVSTTRMIVVAAATVDDTHQPPHRMRMTGTSVLSSFSRSHSARQCATLRLSSKLSDLLLKHKLLRTE